MKKVKFKCPECGSENVIGWVENVVEIEYHLNSKCINGSYVSKKKVPHSERTIEAFQNRGYKCVDCNAWCNENLNSRYDQSWRIKENKKEKKDENN